MTEKFHELIPKELIEHEKLAVVTVGIPRSGKSTAAKALSEQYGLTIVSTDTKREELTGSESDLSQDHRVWQEVYEDSGKILEKGGSLIFDATQTSKEQRKKTTDMFRQFGANAIVAAVFYAELEEALARNERCKQQGGRHVPPEVIQQMHERLLRNPVTEEEDFDERVFFTPEDASRYIANN